MDAPSFLVALADEPLAARLRPLLAELGGTVRQVESGVEIAKILLRGEVFDAVIAAARLPGLSGVQAAKLARAHGVETPFLVISIMGDPSQRASIAPVANADLVLLPVSDAVLRERLRALLHRTPAGRG